MVIRNGRGMTMVEVIVATAVTSVVLMAVTQVMMVSRKAIVQTAVECDLAAQAVSVADRIANELKDAIVSTVSPNSTSSSPTLAFQKCLGFGTSSFVLSPTITYEPYEDPIRNVWCVRRTEAGVGTMELTDALKPGIPVAEQTPPVVDPKMLCGLQFFRVDTSSISHQDVWYVEVTLIRGPFSVKRSTKVQLKF